VELKNNEMERLYAETFHSIAEGTILKGRVLALKQDGGLSRLWNFQKKNSNQ